MRVTNAERANHAWFALSDAESCRLLCCSLTRLGKHHVDEFGLLRNSVQEQEQGVAMTDSDTTDNAAERERRFASEIVGWLRKKAVQQKIDHLVILSPPRMLGVLRKVPLGSLNGHVTEFKGDLMHLNAGQLADHSIVRSLFSGDAD